MQIILGTICAGGDTISVFPFDNGLQIFARSIGNVSHLYTSMIFNGKLSPWQMIGDRSSILLTDAAVAWNSFTNVCNRT